MGTPGGGCWSVVGCGRSRPARSIIRPPTVALRTDSGRCHHRCGLGSFIVHRPRVCTCRSSKGISQTGLRFDTQYLKRDTSRRFDIITSFPARNVPASENARAKAEKGSHRRQSIRRFVGTTKDSLNGKKKTGHTDPNQENHPSRFNLLTDISSTATTRRLRTHLARRSATKARTMPPKSSTLPARTNTAS